MNLYELTKKYGKGKGESTMWSTLSLVSDAVEHSMPEEDKDRLLRRLLADMNGGHYEEDFAREDVAKMFYSDGRGMRHDAPYWTDDEINSVYSSIRSEIPEYGYWDFFVALNMVKSDNCALLSRWFPELPKDQMDARLVEMTVNWLNDEDAKHPGAKIWYYLNS